MDYIMVGLAVVLLAGQLTINKLFQITGGSGLRSGAVFNIIMGAVTALIFFVYNGFALAASPYSVMMAAIMTACAGGYMLISFKLMETGSMALYSLFLMLGGMILPYIYGVAFLGESLSAVRTAGLVLMAVAMALTGAAEKKGGKRAAVLCAMVFVLNGVVSIISKVHQTDVTHSAVGTTDFIILTGLVKVVLFASILPFARKKQDENGALGAKAVMAVALSAVVGGISYFLQLSGAKTLPATVLYPMVTGGSVVLTTLLGCICFHEKLSRRGAAGVAICLAATLMFL